MLAYEDDLLESAPHRFERFVSEPGGSEGIDFQSLEVGTTIDVHTRYSSYHLVVTDPDNRQARVTGGRHFPESTAIRVEGATAGGTAIKTGWIGVGLRLEMRDLTRRVTTSPVQSMTVEPPLPSRVC